MDRSVDVAISRLRKLLDNATEPYRIKTVRNKGYLFAPTPGKPDDVVIRNRLSVRRLPDAIKWGSPGFKGLALDDHRTQKRGYALFRAPDPMIFSALFMLTFFPVMCFAASFRAMFMAVAVTGFTFPLTRFDLL
jgi:hypothetical protein